MKGKLDKTNQGWNVVYDAFQNDYCYPFPAYNIIPLHPQDIDTYLFNLEQGTEIDFEIHCFWDTGLAEVINIAKILPPDIKKDSLDFLANQAQELNMGYESEWDEFFEKSEKILKFELPLRYKNWLKNTYQKPQTF
jgi:hypothetical protein